MATSKETARQSYIRILESEAQRSLRVQERDAVLGAELVEAMHLKGSAIRDHDGEPRDVGLYGITVEGRLFLQKLKKEEFEDSWRGFFSKHGN